MAENDTTRRRFLQVAGATATTIALAGCASNGGSDGGDSKSEGGGSNESMSEGDSMENESMSDGGGNESMSDGQSMENESAGGGESMEDGGMSPTDPADAPRASVDRFSEAAGTLFVRAKNDALPGPDEPIDFDSKPFLTQGFGPDGQTVQYYNFDVQPREPAPIYAFFRENGDPVEGQLNVIGAIPGDEGYNDFWQVNKVTVPDGYEANAITDVGSLMDADYDVQTTNVIKNCPVVPDGSTASKRHGEGSAELVDGWYDGTVVSYFLFEEAPLKASNGSVPLSPIYVSFNKNPGQDGGGPPSGFMTESGSAQTHNVVATVPGDDGYSPLWMVNVYDNADFGSVSDLSSATEANILASGAANVNCPIVSVA